MSEKILFKVAALWFELDSNLRPSSYKAQNIPLHYRIPSVYKLMWKEIPEEAIPPKKYVNFQQPKSIRYTQMFPGSQTDVCYPVAWISCLLRLAP